MKRPTTAEPSHFGADDDEQELLRQMKSVDAKVRNAAFERCVQTYSRRVYALAYRLIGEAAEAEDLTQETFIQMLQSLPRFQAASSLGTWLHRITLNAYIDHTRSGRYKYAAAWNDARDAQALRLLESPVRALPDEQLESALFAERFEAALRGLSPQQRAVAVLRFTEGYSLEEIAEELGVHIGTVKTLLFRAVRALRVALKPFYNNVVANSEP
jgi:RNA polymerase sigma-70 factor (ECF subfamily)